jgi:hypothetical protein
MHITNSDILKRVQWELRNATGKDATEFRLLRAKGGVHVYKCLHDGLPVVVKYFERAEDKREICNYRILQAHGVPTIRTYALGESIIAMEDISLSDEWRLGIETDMNDVCVARGLARWYFALHEAGADLPELSSLYFEYDEITREHLLELGCNLPDAAESFSFLLERFDALRAHLDKPVCTLTYNDFHWTNFIVHRDKRAALMFDYNLLGRGYRYADFRNLRSLSNETYRQFVDTYEGLYLRKHGTGRAEAQNEEARIDAVAAPLFALMAAYQLEHFPDWAEEEKRMVLDGTLLRAARQLLT